MPISFRPLTLRVRILAPAVLVAIPALALLVYMSLERRQQAASVIDESAEQVARLASVNQERMIEGTRQFLVAMSQSSDIRRGTPQSCEEEMRRLLQLFDPIYNNLGVADADGNTVCAGLRGSPGSVTDRSFYQIVLKTKAFAVGEYQVGRVTRRPGLPFAYPLTDPDGTLRGLVFAIVDLEGLNKTLVDPEWPSNVTVTVTDRNETVIARYPDWQSWIGRSLKDDAIVKAAGDRAGGSIEFQEAGETRLTAFAHVLRPAGTGMTVRVFISKSQAMAAANRTMYEGLAALGLVALLVTVGVRATSERLIIRPIVQLTKASRRLAVGDLGARAASSTTIPELSELGKDFDDMAAALEEREAARLRAEMERKDLEQQYHQAQKMDAVGRLAGGIAHDFNNMLTAILGYCELLLEDKAIDEAQRGDVLEIQKAGRTAASLTRQLLAFSRREIIEPVVLDVNAILSGMDKMLHRLLGEQIRVETRLAPDLCRVKADRGQIEQVILNLLVNARDAMPNGGRVLVETANVDLPGGVSSAYLAAPPGRYVMLAVADEGSGVPDHVVPHLFEPFFTTKGTGKGTGLGLATIYGIVKQGGGGIVVESQAARGSVFRIYMPQSDERASDAPDATVVEPLPASKATILVVEDDPGIRELAARILARAGYVVLTASGGPEARSLCERYDRAIDLLLSDVVMPGMSGPEVAAALTGMRPSLKVVYMSGYTDDAILRHGVMVHDTAFLQKPFTPERLTNKILEVLGSRG